MNIFQQRALEAVAALAERHKCIKAIYIFGSVARGQTAGANDIDLAVQYVDNTHDLSEDYTQFQGRYQDWALEQSERLARRIRFSHIYCSDKRQGDLVWELIVKAARQPVGSLGKAVMAATPPKFSSLV
jgi:predicted nucleotidyltransferase